MPTTVNDFRAKAVTSALAPLFIRMNYIADQAIQEESRLERGERLEIAGLGSIQVGASGSVDVVAQSVAADSLDLFVDLDPMINIEVKIKEREQNLRGNWDNNLAQQATTRLRNYIDSEIADYLARVVAFDTGTEATHHYNVNGAKLTSEPILAAQAAIESNDGYGGRSAMFAHPFGKANIMAIPEFVPNHTQAEQGNLGIPLLGSIYGMPVYTSQSVLRDQAAISNQWAVSGGTLTVTLAATGHGFVPGQLVTFDTVTAGGDLATATAITSVTDTTVTIESSGLSNGGASEAGTLRGQTALNLIVDLDHYHVAMQRRPEVRFVNRENRSSDNMQVTGLYGRVARTGRVKVLHTAAASVPTS
ncbi:MAG: hypothetical protein AAGJ19_13805 [Myxococcota bacterium]